MAEAILEEYVRPVTVYDANGYEIAKQAEDVIAAVDASRTTAAWGAREFHNLHEGARASGNVTSAHSLLKAADLDWDPEFATLQVNGANVPAEVGRAVVRSDSKQPIGIVGGRYALIPHRKLADLADALCGTSASALHFGNAGHKKNGARPFIQLKGEARTVGKDVRGCDVDVSDVITLMTAHDGTLQILGCYGANVIVCDNTYAHALSAAKSRGISIRHTAAGVEMVEEAIRIASEAHKLHVAFDNAALRLLATPFEDRSMQQLASALIPGDTTRADAARTKLLDAWASSPGAAPGTAWGAAQAVTYYTSHEIGAFEGTDRAFNLATGEGRGSGIQATAWWHLTTDEGAEALKQVQLVKVVRA
jgi:predicted Fe-Mo cluster-binding NifX family protein